MNYITLTPEIFFDERGKPSMEYLSYYCKLKTTSKFIYEGKISGELNPKLKFPKVVKTMSVQTRYFAKQFPDLEHVGIIYYYVKGAPDIGNLKSADTFYIYFYNNISMTMPFIRKYINIIDENRLIINGKELNVNNFWKIGSVSSVNYKGRGL